MNLILDEHVKSLVDVLFGKGIKPPFSIKQSHSCTDIVGGDSFICGFGDISHSSERMAMAKLITLLLNSAFSEMQKVETTGHHIWIARDLNGEIWAFTRRPIRKQDEWKSSQTGLCFPLTDAYYPELTWEKSPVKLELQNDIRI